MTPPEAPMDGTKAATGDLPSAVSLRLTTLTQRRDFQRASRAKRVAMPGFILQMRQRADDEVAGLRIGYTCSKKVGNAVARNRAKRRLREIARSILPTGGQIGVDYVLVGRNRATAALPFETMLSDLNKALIILHQGKS